MNRLSILKWFGGKYYQLDAILPFPKHETYLELFGGGGTVLLNKIRSKFEIYNDINGSLVNFWKVFRNDYHLFRLLCFCLPKSQHMFNSLVEDDYDGLIPSFMKPLLGEIDAEAIEEAVGFYAKNIYSFSGNNIHFSGLHLDRSKTVPSKIERVNNFLYRAWNRIRDVQFTCRDYKDILKKADKKWVLMYIDPPYVDAGKYYLQISKNNELWDEKHYHELAEKLCSIEKAKFVLSIDDPGFFEGNGWNIEPVKQASFFSNTKKKSIKTEYLIRNFDNEKETKMSPAGSTTLHDFVDPFKNDGEGW